MSRDEARGANRLPPLFTTADFLILLAVGGFSLAFFAFRQFDKAGAGAVTAVVQIEDRIVAELDISRDTTFITEGVLGKVSVVVSGGEVGLVDSPCPLKICEKTGRISRRGEIIVCAPNQVLVKIITGTTDAGPVLDAVSR